MEDLALAFVEIKQDIPWRNIFLGFGVFIFGQLIFRSLDWMLRQFFKEIAETQKNHNFRKFVVYSFNIVLILLVLKILKIELKYIAGAAGFLTIAIGFAARTPISNLISGIFLVFERPFVVGDIVEVNEYRGEVISLNLLSLTMRTLDNLMVRIPNELVIGTAVRNISFFPIRRLELKFYLSQRESLTRLQEVFNRVAERNELALDEPSPYFRVSGFQENSIEVSFQVWCSAEDFLVFQSEFPKEIHRAVKNAGFEPVQTVTEILRREGMKEKS